MFRRTPVAAATFALFVLVGAGCGPTPSPAPTPAVNQPPQSENATFGTPFTLAVGEHATFDGGLTVTLKEIGDSRCPADVQCIWEGELSPLLIASGGLFSTETEVRLGTSRAQNVSASGYAFALNDATTTTATVTITAGRADAN